MDDYDMCDELWELSPFWSNIGRDGPCVYLGETLKLVIAICPDVLDRLDSF